jgi:hypothetical protein
VVEKLVVVLVTIGGQFAWHHALPALLPQQSFFKHFLVVSGVTVCVLAPA